MRDWIIGIVFVLLGGLAILGAVCLSPSIPPMEVRNSTSLLECNEWVDYEKRLGADSSDVLDWNEWCLENMPDSPYYKKWRSLR